MPEGIEVARAFVTIIPKTDGTAGNVINQLAMPLGQGADKAGLLAGKKFTAGLGSAIAKFAGAAAIGSVLKKSIAEGANLEQSIGGIETLFKSSSDEMIKNADRAFKTAGISANKYMEQATSFSASLLQSTGGDTQKAAQAADKAIIDMSDNANKMGSNIADIQNAYQGFAKQNYTMLDNLKLGYGGTKTEMERLLSDAQKISGQKYDISNLSDVYEAIHVIQTDLDITGTSSKEAASTISGSFASMKAAADNMLGNLALGRNIGPAMAGLAETAGTFLFDNLMPAIGNVVASLPEAISTLVSTGAPAFLNSGIQMVGSIADGFSAGVPMIAKKGPQVITGLMNTITSKLPGLLSEGRQMVVNIAGGLISNIPSLITGASQLVSRFTEFITKNLPMIAQQGSTMVQQLAEKMVTKLPSIVVAAGKLTAALIRALVKVIPTVIKSGVSMAAGLASGIGGSAVKAVRSAAGKVASALLSPIKSVTTKIRSVVSTVKSYMSFSGLSSKVSNVFSKIKDGMIKPIKAAQEKVKDIIDKIKGIFPLSIGKIFSNLKLPSITVSKGSPPYGIGGKGSLPHFSVNWHRRAYDEPYIFDKPTVMVNGYGDGPGEEIVYGRNNLLQDIREVTEGSGETNNTFNVNMYVGETESPEQFAQRTFRELRRLARTGGTV